MASGNTKSADNKIISKIFIDTADGNEVAKVIYSPDKPLSCGARVWIETQNEVECID